MAGTRQPLQLLEAKGAKHLTKAEKAEREKSEVKADKPKYVLPPKYLPDSLRKEFSEISRALIDLGIFCKLDRDTLAAYLIARNLWLQATQMVTAAMQRQDSRLTGEWASTQDKYFKQARNAANDLGLTITSRCRLVVPDSGTAQEPEDAFGGELARLFG